MGFRSSSRRGLESFGIPVAGETGLIAFGMLASQRPLVDRGRGRGRTGRHVVAALSVLERIGGIVWASGVGLLAYFGGNALADSISRYGLEAGVAIAVVTVVIFARPELLARRQSNAAEHPRTRRSLVAEVAGNLELGSILTEA